MRADRLIRVLFVLQSRPVVTAAELAAELEVSVPTARRDLEALAASGVPLYPQRGRGGGWQLLGGARTNLTGLTEGEAHALFALLGQVDGAPDSAASAVTKLMQAIPSSFRAGAERVAASTVTAAAWGEEDDAMTPPTTVVELQTAIARQRLVRVGYRDRAPRDVVPLVVARRGRHWYLLAAAADVDGVAEVVDARMLRLDRVRSLALLDEHGAPPADFSPRQAWARAIDEVEQLRGRSRAEVLVRPFAVRPMLDVLGVQAREIDADPRPDGRVLLEVRAQHDRALAEQLAGWCDVIEVLGPEAVRTALAALGERLVRAYGPLPA